MATYFRRLIWVFFLTILMATGLQAGPSNSAVEPILKSVETKYSSTSFQADFIQESTLAALEMTETASGRAWFSHPQKMKWRYLSPEAHEIITNGQWIWIFRPQENQVMKGDAKSFFAGGAGGAFLTDMGSLRKNYTIELDKQSAHWAELVLTPRSSSKKGSPLQQELLNIRIGVHLPDPVIQEVTTTNIHGDTTRFKFKNIQFKPLSPKQFEFEIPPGVDLIRMDE